MTISRGLRSEINEYENFCPLQEIGKYLKKKFEFFQILLFLWFAHLFFIYVGCIVNNENVWVNIQKSARPGELIYDIENKSYWMPFLGEKSYQKYFPNKISTIQSELIYEKIDDQFIDGLEFKIQNYLKKK